MLLVKGLKFILVFRVNNVKSVVIKDFNEFVRKFRCLYYYSIGDDFKIYFFRKLLGYIFLKICNVFEEYIDKIKMELIFL